MNKRIDDFMGNVHHVIQTFPTSYNGKQYLRLKNNQKLFLCIFIKKYGIDGSPSSYSYQDLLRRLRCVEFFDYIVKQYDFI